MVEKVSEDEKTIKLNIKDLEERWFKQKPYSGDLNPDWALEQLNIIELEMKSIKKKLLEICQAKDLLGLEKGDPKKLDGL